MNQAAPMLDMRFVEADGATVRAKPEQHAAGLMRIISDGGAVLLRNYLTPGEVASLKQAAIDLKRQEAAIWRPYSPQCADFHHLDMDTPADENRRLEKGQLPRPRRMHMHKFLLWNNHTEEFTRAATSVIRLRNILYGNDPEFAIDPQSDFFTVVQVIHYRRGGDFLTTHSDAYFQQQQGKAAKAEIISFLTQKGRDFSTGGLTIPRWGKTYDIDGMSGPGDLIIYNVTYQHGCDPVDIDQTPDPDGRLGRWTLLVPPYAKKIHFKSGGT